MRGDNGFVLLRMLGAGEYLNETLVEHDFRSHDDALVDDIDPDVFLRGEPLEFWVTVGPCRLAGQGRLGGFLGDRRPGPRR